MAEHEAVRTLVKSGPELWAQCSDVESLSRHLHAFGQIRITRLEPEDTVAWEGERARGTVRLEPAGWGTKVTLTAEVPEAPDADAAPRGETAQAGGLLAWLTGRLRTRKAPPPPSAPPDRGVALDAALDSLGQAHRRPFSRN